MTTVRLDEQLCFALHAASRRMTAAYREPLRRLGLTYPQYLVMLTLWERDEQGVNELGNRLKLDSGTLSPLLKRLQARGLITRGTSPADERRVVVRLTPEGHALSAQADDIQRCVVSAVDLEPDEVVTLRDLARRLASFEQA